MGDGWAVRAPGCDEGKQPLGGGLWRKLATGIDRRSFWRANVMACPAEDRRGLGRT